MVSEMLHARRCLTKKAEPPPTRDVNRDSGTASANGGWLRRLVRRRHIQAGLIIAATALAHRMIPAPKHPTGLVGPTLDING